MLNIVNFNIIFCQTTKIGRVREYMSQTIDLKRYKYTCTDKYVGELIELIKG